MKAVRRWIYTSAFMDLLDTLDRSSEDHCAAAAREIRLMADTIRVQDGRIGGLMAAVRIVKDNRDRLRDENAMLRARLLLARRADA